MNKKYINIAIVCVVLICVFIGIKMYLPRSRQIDTDTSKKIADVQYKNATYVIDSVPVTLTNGGAVSDVIPGSSSKITTRYFGNEARGDINGDGQEDIVFLLTQDTGGSGTFYYVTAALQGDNGYSGINAVLLGDRIAPQTTQIKDQQIIVNYADRKSGEPMTNQPTIGVSRYLGIVDGVLIEEQNPNSKPGKMTEQEARVIAAKTCIKGGEALSAGTYNDTSKTWWFDANLNATKPGCYPACVVGEGVKTAEINWRCTGLIPPEKTIEYALRELFVDKYPWYASTMKVTITHETGAYVRGSVSFELGDPGGIFLAYQKNGAWEIAYEGNGAIPCAMSEKGFPENMISDCAK